MAGEGDSGMTAEERHDQAILLSVKSPYSIKQCRELLDSIDLDIQETDEVVIGIARFIVEQCQNKNILHPIYLWNVFVNSQTLK